MKIINTESESTYPSIIFCSPKDFCDTIGHALRSSPLRKPLGRFSDLILSLSVRNLQKRRSSIFLKLLHSSEAFSPLWCPATHLSSLPPWSTLFRYITRFYNFGKVWVQNNNCLLVGCCIVKLIHKCSPDLGQDYKSLRQCTQMTMILSKYRF